MIWLCSLLIDTRRSFLEEVAVTASTTVQRERNVRYSTLLQPNPCAVLGIENPLLDIYVNVTKNAGILKKYDLQVGKTILAQEKHFPLFAELVNDDGEPPKYLAGGSTLNSIRVTQWMLNAAQKPNCAAFMGCIGNDEFGEHLEKAAREAGVYTCLFRDKKLPTGTCANLITDDGERTLVANLGAAAHFDKYLLDTQVAKQLYRSAQYIYIAGFFLDVSAESCLAMAQYAANNNKVFCLNLSAPYIIEMYRNELDNIMLYTDFLFCNDVEATTFAKKHEVEEDLRRVALWMSALPKRNKRRPRTVIFTRGSKSTIVAQTGKVTEYPVKPIPRELLVDTSGAGDAFVGGFLSQLVLGRSAEESIMAAHWCSRYVLKQSGCSLQAQCDYEDTREEWYKVVF